MLSVRLSVYWSVQVQLHILQRKKTDKAQYLLTSSCHPFHIFDNIPYSLELRIVRICSEKVKKYKQMFYYAQVQVWVAPLPS